MRGELHGVGVRLLRWSDQEAAFLDRLHEDGEIEASLLRTDPEVQRRIEQQPMIQWNARNVREFRSGSQ